MQREPGERAVDPHVAGKLYDRGAVSDGGEQDPVGGDFGDGGAEPDLDAAFGQLAACVVAQGGVEGRQQRRGPLDQRNVQAGPVDLGIGDREGYVAQLGCRVRAL